ncbi:MAG TPA: T9SS type A sorting domain-containing protein [Bacteroidales bacterium]|nr:T9SS type A sorting domain-containing protein [Bacteroidales bacterium]
MKKSIVLAFFAVITARLFCNPISLPPVMSEFYLVNESEWFLEIYIDPMYGDYFQDTYTLDGLMISSSSGSSIVKDGISINVGEIIILTQDSMQNSVQFERNGDFLEIENFNVGIGETYKFGDVQYSQISALAEGQSLINYQYTCYYTHGEMPFHDIIEYRLIKENSPNIGFETAPFTPVSCNGLFCGIVLDGSDNPVSGIMLGYECNAPENICDHVTNCTITDENGHFSVDELSCMHHIDIFYFNFESIVYADSTINIEPDTDNYFEFHLDTIFSEKQSISINPMLTFEAFPNPTDNEISFNIQFINNRFPNHVLIKIYNLSGEIVKIIPVKDNLGNTTTVTWDCNRQNMSICSGQYICKLEFDGKIQAETKLIITR